MMENKEQGNMQIAAFHSLELAFEMVRPKSFSSSKYCTIYFFFLSSEGVTLALYAILGIDIYWR